LKTDAHFLNIFRAFPAELYRLLGLPDPGPCTVQSVEVKELIRRADCLATPEDPAQELLAVEFQLNRDEGIYDRIIMEAASIRMSQPSRSIRMAIVFGTAALDPRTAPWNKFVQAIYLDEVIPALARSEPNHFLVALFRPLLEPEDKKVEKFAASDYAKLKNLILPTTHRAISPSLLADIFLDWLLQRFTALNTSQISKMIIQLTPLEETVAGKELIGIGLERGMERGMEFTLLRQLARKFGPLSAKLKQQVESLDHQALEELTEAIFDFATLEDFTQWLVAKQ
jgi:hypothetical protein